MKLLNTQYSEFTDSFQPPLPKKLPGITNSKKHNKDVMHLDSPERIWEYGYKNDFSTTQSQDYSNKFIDKHRLCKEIPPYKNYRDEVGLYNNRISNVQVWCKLGLNNANEVLQQRMLKLSGPKIITPPDHRLFTDTTYRLDYKVKGFELNVDNRLSKQGKIVNKHEINDDKIVNKRFEALKKTKEDQKHNYYISNVTSVGDLQAKKSGKQNFMDNIILAKPNERIVNRGICNHPKEVPLGNIHYDKGGDIGLRGPKDNFKERYSIEVIPKVWSSKEGNINDSTQLNCIKNYQYYKNFTSENKLSGDHLKYLRGEAINRLVNRGIEKNSLEKVDDRFLLTTTGCTYATNISTV